MKEIDFHNWYVKKGRAFQLEDTPTLPSGKELAVQKEWLLEFNRIAEKLNRLQSTLHASKARGLLLVLQGMDASGKDGVIRSVFSHVSPLGARAEAFGVPSEEERHHDFLWRIHHKTPALGEIVIFNRSHYEDVLVPRVLGLIGKGTWEKRFRHIMNFESMLVDAGISVVKCYLHISNQEQKKRLQTRLDDPHKRWKLQASDFSDRKLWSKYLAAYQDAMTATSSAATPWYVVPADSKDYRDLFLARLLVHTLEKMHLVLPKPSFDLSSVDLK
jgi:PPK2 family polyphosphate:nucleotide phosphotransferase